jgi:hypothetical protein
MKYVLALSMVILFACKNNSPTVEQKSASTENKSEKDNTNTGTAMPDSGKPADSKTSTQQPKSTNPSDSLYRLVIVFFSSGSGVENLLMNEYLDSLGFYNQDHGKKIDYIIDHWGREGETDIAMHLKELTPAEQSDFIGMTRRVLAKGEHVHIYENYQWHRKGK